MNLRNTTQVRKCGSEKSTLALKPRAEVQNRGISGPHLKRTYALLFFLKKLIYVNIDYLKYQLLAFTKLFCPLRIFTIPNLTKIKIVIDFNGILGHFCGIITH